MSRIKITTIPHSGIPDIFIDLRGAGTYDQKLEAILDI
jgi:hypothetical protein